MGICSLLLLLGDLKNTSVPGGVGGRRHGKQRIVSVFVVFSCLFVMPGDHEVGKKVGVLQRSEVNSGRVFICSSPQRIKPCFSHKKEQITRQPQGQTLLEIP